MKDAVVHYIRGVGGHQLATMSLEEAVKTLDFGGDKVFQAGSEVVRTPEDLQKLVEKSKDDLPEITIWDFTAREPVGG